MSKPIPVRKFQMLDPETNKWIPDLTNPEPAENTVRRQARNKRKQELTPRRKARKAQRKARKANRA